MINMDRLLSWLRIWGGPGCTYWCPDEIWSELHKLGLVEGINITTRGQAALSSQEPQK